MLTAHAAFMGRYNAEQAKITAAQAEKEAAEEAAWAEIEAEAEHMAEMLPLYLHYCDLSYTRSVSDRKSENFSERVEYCHVVDWEITEDTYYFWIGTFFPYPLPRKIRVPHFYDETLWDTLGKNFGSRVWVEATNEDGLWICVERRAGRGQVPKYCTYQALLSEMPKSADPLSFPLGQGVNRRNYVLDT